MKTVFTQLTKISHQQKKYCLSVVQVDNLKKYRKATQEFFAQEIFHTTNLYWDLSNGVSHMVGWEKEEESSEALWPEAVATEALPHQPLSEVKVANKCHEIAYQWHLVTVLAPTATATVIYWPYCSLKSRFLLRNRFDKRCNWLERFGLNFNFNQRCTVPNGQYSFWVKLYIWLFRNVVKLKGAPQRLSIIFKTISKLIVPW